MRDSISVQLRLGQRRVERLIDVFRPAHQPSGGWGPFRPVFRCRSAGGALSCSVLLSISETALARQVPPAAPGEFRPINLSSIRLWPPIVLAPMAGVTNFPFRSLCRQFGAPLCIGEMVTARPLAQRVQRTVALAAFGSDETPKSLQLYGTDPYWISEAVKYLVSEKGVAHIDLNFGCPVRKVTSQGGGAALPHKPRLLAKIIRAAVESSGRVPITAKFRMGIDHGHHVFIATGQIAQEEGCAAVTLHARTAEQLYAGIADWNAIAELKQRVAIPVFGNGDVWEAADAIRMLRSTGCDGVVIGRGCLGRPWLFEDLRRLFEGVRPRHAPTVGEVIDTMLEHARRQAGWLGERVGIRSFRRHASWYTKGFRSSAGLRRELMTVESLEGLHRLLSRLDRMAAYPQEALRAARCKDSTTQRVSLPAGYLDNPDDETLPPEHECNDGG
jgi:nifR3 family TIM-barrel protein